MSNLPVRSISLRGLSKAEANAKAQKFIDEIYAESIARFETSLRNRGYTSREIADAIATWREIEREQRGASH